MFAIIFYKSAIVHQCLKTLIIRCDLHSPTYVYWRDLHLYEFIYIRVLGGHGGYLRRCSRDLRQRGSRAREQADPQGKEGQPLLPEDIRVEEASRCLLSSRQSQCFHIVWIQMLFLLMLFCKGIVSMNSGADSFGFEIA